MGLFFSLIALADESQTNLPKAKEKKTQSKSGSIADSDFVLSNSAIRRDKSIYFAVEPISFTLSPMVGLRAGVYANKNLAFESSLNLGGFLVGKGLVEFKAKYFLLDSFYVDAGYSREAFIMKYDSDFDSSRSSDPNNQTEQPTKEDTVVTNDGIVVHLGNQWNWNTFTMGCDWIGYMLAVHTEVKKPRVVDEYWGNRVSWLKGDSLHLLRVYLGVAF